MTGANLLPPPPPGARVIDTGWVRFWLEGGLVFNESYRGGTVEAQTLLRGFDAVDELTGGRAVPMVVWAPRSGDATREAREVFAGPRAAQLMLAMAVIQPTPVMRAVMNFFSRLYSTTYPIRFFATAEEAIAWARTFLPPASEGQAQR